MSISLSDKLKMVRTQLNYSQKDFAASLGIKQGTLSDIERGRISVSPKVAATLFEKHNVNKGWFYTGEGDLFIVKNYILKGRNKGLNEGLLIDLQQQNNQLRIYQEQFSELRKRKYPEFEQIKNDVITIVSADEIFDAIVNSKIAKFIFLDGGDLKKNISYNEYKDLNIQVFKEILPYKDFLNEYAEATRKFIAKLKEIKDEIDLDFEFEE